jgi:serine/threonine-protein kinase
VPSGHLLYIQQGTLFAAPMDLKRLELTGQPIPLLQNMEPDFVRGLLPFDFSRTGMFAVFPASSGQARLTLRWLEPSGQPQNLPAVEPAFYLRLRLSPDAKKLAEIIIDSAANSLWVRDLQAERLSRLTFKGSADAPAWAPDGAHIAYYLSEGTSAAIYWARADGAGEPVRLTEQVQAHPDAFSPDGKWLLYHVHNKGGVSIWKMSIDATDPDHPKAGKPEAFLQGPFQQEYTAFSPDGRWIAYRSTESGREEIYVRPFPGPGGKWLISGGGGTYPLWSRSAHELLYFGHDGRVQAVDYTAQGDSFIAGKPRPWSPVQVALRPSLYDLMPDGKHLLIAVPEESADGANSNMHVTVMMNFFDELRRRAPAAK